MLTGSAPLLAVEHLHVHFGALKAVADVSFHVMPNEVVGLVGPNGAGKTTTFNAIGGLLAPTSGRATLAGQEITGRSPEQVARAGITRTFQNVRLFAELSVLENVMMGACAISRCGVLAAMVRLGRHGRFERLARERARHWIDRLGLTDYAGIPAVTLPLGLQRIAEVARALAGEPKLVLLDEPAAGLNATEKARLSELLCAVSQESGCALLLVEHDMPLVMGLVDRVIVLDFGQKLAEGRPADIAADPDVIRVYLGA
jgi:ABC-type branched-subunit amino acid transport system ATPase component